MPQDNDATLLLVGSGLLIAAYYATKETERPARDDDWPDMPEMEVEDFGPKKKPKQDGDAEAALINFAEDSQGALQKLLSKAQLLAQEVTAQQEKGVWPLSAGTTNRVNRLQDQLMEAVVEYDALIGRAAFEAGTNPGFYQSRQSYRQLHTFRDLMHAAVTSSDAILQWLEQRESVVNNVQTDYHYTQNQMVDRRSITFDQKNYDRRKFNQKNIKTVNNFDQTNVELSLVDSQTTFQQLNVGPQPSRGFDDPPDNSIGGRAAPRLGAAQHSGMVQSRNDLMIMPSANTLPLNVEPAQPIQENPPAEKQNFTSLKKGREFYRDDPEPQRKVRTGDKRRRSEAELQQVQPSKLRGVDPEMVVDEVSFQAAARPDVNTAAGMPENRLIVREPLFNQLGEITESPDEVVDAGLVYIDRVDEALNNFKKIRIRNSENVGKVGMAAWRILKTAPLGGENGEIFVKEEGGSQYTWRCEDPQQWIAIMQSQDADAGGISVSQVRLLKNSLGGRKYEHASMEAVRHMKKTYGRFDAEDHYYGLR
jgi:hypothetical protein